MKYEFSVAGPALAKLLNFTRREAWRMHDCFGVIAAHPSAEPDLKLREAGGRVIFVRVEGDWLINYWVDDAERRVIILDIEDTQPGTPT